MNMLENVGFADSRIDRPLTPLLQRLVRHLLGSSGGDAFAPRFLTASLALLYACPFIYQSS